MRLELEIPEVIGGEVITCDHLTSDHLKNRGKFKMYFVEGIKATVDA